MIFYWILNSALWFWELIVKIIGSVGFIIPNEVEDSINYLFSYIHYAKFIIPETWYNAIINTTLMGLATLGIIFLVKTIQKVLKVIPFIRDIELIREVENLNTASTGIENMHHPTDSFAMRKFLIKKGRYRQKQHGSQGRNW